MATMTVLGTAAIVFVITNVDAFVVLTLLFAASRSTGVPRPAQIVVGQYLGFMAWVAVSVLAAAGLHLVSDAWVGLLGVLPLALGLHGLLRARHRDPTYVSATGTLSVAVLTIANGIDNVTVYVLHFITLPPRNEALTIATFFVLLAVWCVAAALIGSHKKVSTLVGAAGRWLIPTMFIIIGAWVLIRSGVLTKLPALASPGAPEFAIASQE
jgi:cadmium resistance protein CadD (predicted permease)